MTVFKRREFAKWQADEKLADSALCKAVQEMESGLVDADLGGCLYKKRIARDGGGKSGGYRTLLSARDGGGKSGGYRTLLSARVGVRYVFLFGFAKSARADISVEEKKALRYASSVFLGLSPEDLALAIQVGT